ncbi:MAG: hypothetical protein HY707_03140 [Ignavibacteriae bacterium]|nr:hypothetical protein [Ignavibacteriota bacterium]
MYYRTRTQFTENDFDFITQTLGKSQHEQGALRELLVDPFTLTELLHEKQLFQRSMTIPPLFLSISPSLFFYLFIYHALDKKDIADDDVVDYVAGICVEFRSSKSFWHLPSSGKTIYVVDLLNLLNDVDKPQQYYLRRYIGNVALFLTGFFPDFIFKRSKSKSAPPIEYYENVGKSQYETAAEDSLRYDEHAAPVLNILAERFVDIRSALNIYTDAYLHLNKKKHSLEIIERQAATLNEESFRQSIEL